MPNLKEMEWYEIRDYLNNLSIWSKGYLDLVKAATEELLSRGMLLVRSSYTWVVAR